MPISGSSAGLSPRSQTAITHAKGFCRMTSGFIKNGDRQSLLVFKLSPTTPSKDIAGGRAMSGLTPPIARLASTTPITENVSVGDR